MEGESGVGSVGPSFTEGRLQSFASSVRHHIVGVLCEGVCEGEGKGGIVGDYGGLILRSHGVPSVLMHLYKGSYVGQRMFLTVIARRCSWARDLREEAKWDIKA